MLLSHLIYTIILSTVPNMLEDVCDNTFMKLLRNYIKRIKTIPGIENVLLDADLHTSQLYEERNNGWNKQTIRYLIIKFKDSISLDASNICGNGTQNGIESSRIPSWRNPCSWTPILTDTIAHPCSKLLPNQNGCISPHLVLRFLHHDRCWMLGNRQSTVFINNMFKSFNLAILIVENGTDRKCFHIRENNYLIPMTFQVIQQTGTPVQTFLNHYIALWCLLERLMLDSSLPCSWPLDTQRNFLMSSFARDCNF